MSLSTIIKPKITELYNKTGAFFAFGDEQFNKAKTEGVKYVQLQSGLICPKENAKQVVEGMSKIIKVGIQDDLRINGKANIIKRELFNYECFYTGDIDDCVDALKDYGINLEEIQQVYSKVLPTIDDF
ncbi:DUF7659 family protein [Pseudoalteromonas sp.]|uniref:DUF7659 family protein n=1 Tax=Pseudoalteromonas TaxID=53246 RepID=UPI003F9945F4